MLVPVLLGYSAVQFPVAAMRTIAGVVTPVRNVLGPVMVTFTGFCDVLAGPIVLLSVVVGSVTVYAVAELAAISPLVLPALAG
jgi:hypothetical protein